MTRACVDEKTPKESKSESTFRSRSVSEEEAPAPASFTPAKATPMSTPFRLKLMEAVWVDALMSRKQPTTSPTCGTYIYSSRYSILGKQYLGFMNISQFICAWQVDNMCINIGENEQHNYFVTIEFHVLRFLNQPALYNFVCIRQTTSYRRKKKVAYKENAFLVIFSCVQTGRVFAC